MGEERRRYPRIRLNIHAKGVIRVDVNFFQYSAMAVHLSKTGVLLKFTEDSSKRAKEKISSGFVFKEAEVMIQLISYVEDNIPATGIVMRISESDNAIMLGVKLNPLGKRSAATLDKILEISPNLKGSNSKETDSIKFANFDEFLVELTQLTILTEKKIPFWIGKEKFAFTGMHRDDNEDLHIDCIESINRPGVVYCPDCRANIPQEHLI